MSAHIYVHLYIGTYMSCILGMNHLYYTCSFVLHNFTEPVMFAHCTLTSRSHTV